MNVALDATYSLGDEPTGIALYSQRLIEALAALRPDDHFQLGYRSNRWARALQTPRPAPNTSRAPLWWARRAALFHGLNQRLPSGSMRCAVTTFHDLFVMTGEYSTPDFRRKFTALARDAAARSDLIIAISAFTARQVNELLDFPNGRIRVVPHGVDPAPAISDAQRAEFLESKGWRGRTVFLHVGAVQTRKNIERLVAAFEQLAGEPLLVLAGSSGYGAETIADRIAGSSARQRIVQLGYVDAATRALLYDSATALVFPSLDEGFGLPVLEAMAAGLPVLTSTTSALSEVGGEAALLVDPRSVDSIRDAMRRLTQDAELRQRLTALGRSRAECFTWNNAAELTWRAYLDALA